MTVATKKKRGRPKKKIKKKVATKSNALAAPPDPVSAKVVGALQPPKLAPDRLHDYGEYNRQLYIEDVLWGMSNVFGINRGLITRTSRNQLKSIVEEHYPLMVKSHLRQLIETREMQIFALIPSHAQKRYKQCLALFDYFATFQYRAEIPEAALPRRRVSTDPPDDCDPIVEADFEVVAESAGAPTVESQEFLDNIANITAPPLLGTNELSVPMDIGTNEQQAETLRPEVQIDVPLDGPVQYRCGHCGDTMDGLPAECPHCGADTEASDAMPIKANGVASDGSEPPG